MKFQCLTLYFTIFLMQILHTIIDKDVNTIMELHWASLYAT